MLLVVVLCTGALSGCAGGTIYNYEDVYITGEITREHLLNIAYHNGDEEINEEAMQNFIPQEIETLSDEVSLKIRKTLVKSGRWTSETRLTVEDFIITDYLGVYNGYHVFQYMNKRWISPDWIVHYAEEIDGVILTHGEDETAVVLWKEN